MSGALPSQSQTSFASSLPASQAISQSQSQEVSELASETADLSLEPSITPNRYNVFKTTLGQLLNTPLFEDDSAEVDKIITAINARIGGAAGGAFSRSEAEAALKQLDEANNIM